MPMPSYTSRRCLRQPLKHLALTIGMLLAATGIAQAQDANPSQRGPLPTDAALEAAAGPFAIKSSRISSPQGFNGGLVYYPSGPVQGPFGLIVLMPGFLAVQGYYTDVTTRLASHGFVVAVLNSNSLTDQPTSRAQQMMAAMKQVVATSANATSPYFAKIDPSRLAVMGHSMGGGATLEAARANPTLMAAVALAPWNQTIKDFRGIQVPTEIVACEKDTIAPNNTHSDVFYASLAPTLPRAYVNVAGADHLCAIGLAPQDKRTLVAKASIVWMKRFVDTDKRYDAFLKNVNDPRYLKFTSAGF